MSSSRKQVATEIAKRYTQEGTGYADRLYQLAFAIEAALKERDERAAKIAENHKFSSEAHGTHSNLCTDAITAAIRSEDTNG